MARIAGLELNDKWKVDYALTRVKGLGWVAAGKVLAATKIEDSRRVASLTAEKWAN
jgi:ribosomal protein S13